MKKRRENSTKSIKSLKGETWDLREKISELEKEKENFRNIEISLRENEENFLDFFNSIPIGLYRSTPDGALLEVNDSLVKMLGFPDKQSLLSTKVPDLFLDAQDRQRETKVLSEKGDIRRYEILLRRYDGKVIWVEDYAHVIRDKSGNIICFEGSIIDITARKKAEKEILEAKETAEEASRIKSQFLANISHEIRTPMNGIIATAELIENLDLTKEQKELLSIIKDSGESLMKIINNMLDFSKIGSDRFVLENVVFNLKKLVTKALDQFQIKANKKNIHFSYNLGTEIPKELYGDPLRLSQVIKNLLNNALKFCNEGEIEFGVKKEVEDQYKIDLHFFVADTGLGIPENKKEEIFEAFTQADGSMTRKYGGTGLGTSISKKLVEMMDGRIWAESPNPNSIGGSPGSVFHFIVSLRKVKKYPDFRKEKIKTKNKPKQTLKKDIQCLLVEDNPINQKIITRIIINFGLQVDLAENGKIGVEKVKNKTYDIIFMDVQMPVMSGLEATKIIKELGVKTPIIALTAHALKEHQEICFDTGMDGYISKPVKKDQIFSALKKFIF